MGGFGPLVAGMSFGAGFAMARGAIDAILVPSAASTAPSAASVHSSNSCTGSDPCGGQLVTLQHCLNTYGSDIGKCQFHMNMLQECRRNKAFTLLI